MNALSLIALAAVGLQDPQPMRPLAGPEGAVVDSVRDAIVARLSDPEFVAFDEEADGTLWAVANGYKAAFAADGWRFIGKPLPGASGSTPVGFHLGSVTVGGERVPLSPAVPARHDRRITYDRGSVVETIDVAGGGVEQTFVFEQLPARGEIVLRVAVDTTLEAGQQEGGIIFCGPHDQIGYSPAIAIDADGRRVDAPTSLVDGVITIRVPSEFVATAALPLRVDPWVHAITVASGTVDLGLPDVAFADSTNSWLVTFVRLFAPGDWDCYAQLVAFGSPMTLLGNLVAIDATTTSWFHPRVAYHGGANRFLVVGQAKTGAGPWSIYGRLVNASGSLHGLAFAIRTSTVDQTLPDVGGDPMHDGFFTVVWQHAKTPTDRDVLARQVNGGGTLVGGVISVAFSVLDETFPTISKSPGGGYIDQRYAIVFQRRSVAGDEDVYLALLTWDGQVVYLGGTGTFAIGVEPGADLLPSVSSPTLGGGAAGQRRMLVAWQRPSVGNGDIFGAIVTQSGVVVASGNITAAENDPIRASWPQNRPSVDCDGHRFVVGYHEVYGGSTTINDLDTRAVIVGPNGSGLFAQEVLSLAATGGREFNLEIASCYSGSGVASPHFLSTHDFDAISGSARSIGAVAFTAAPAGLFTTRATACGTHQITASGQAIPGGTITFGSTATSFVPGFVLGDAASAPIAPCPGCTLGVNGFTTVGASYVVVVPNDPSLVGARFSAQGFVFQPSGAPCLGQIQLSNTIDVTIG
jgi:hypothetical protein